MHKVRKGISAYIQEKSGVILQNMNFSRCYRNRGKVIYGFDPNIISISISIFIFIFIFMIIPILMVIYEFMIVPILMVILIFVINNGQLIIII